jgi:hypothetical protein
MSRIIRFRISELQYEWYQSCKKGGRIRDRERGFPFRDMKNELERIQKKYETYQNIMHVVYIRTTVNN